MALLRRHFLRFTAGAGALAVGGSQALLRAQRPDQDPRLPSVGAEALFTYSDKRAKVALIHGDSRRKNVYDALMAVDEQIMPVLRTRKYVVIKPNCVSGRQLAATHVDALGGILDYLAERYQGPVVVAESCYSPTAAFDSLNYAQAVNEHKPMDIKLEDLNVEGRYGLFNGIDFNLHLVPIRLAARLLDPDAFVISSGVMKTHNMVVATLSIKNLVMGAPIASPRGETPRWNDKRKYHVGIRQGNYNIAMTARHMMSNWGVAVVDGFEGMEGAGPGSGTPVDHRIAIASTDFFAADRVGVECMGIDPAWLGYLNYGHQMGLGQYDLAKIDVAGAAIDDVRKKYQLHNDYERMLQWQGPMVDLPPNLG